MVLLFFGEFPLSRSSKHHDAQKRLGRRRRRRKKNGAIAFKLSSISSPRAVLSRRRGGWTFASGRKRPGELLRAFFSSFLDRENERFWGRENRAVARRDAPRRDGFCDHRYLRRGDVFRGERARVARGTRSRLVFFFCLSFACSLEGSLSLFFT